MYLTKIVHNNDAILNKTPVQRASETALCYQYNFAPPSAKHDCGFSLQLFLDQCFARARTCVKCQKQCSFHVNLCVVCSVWTCVFSQKVWLGRKKNRLFISNSCQQRVNWCALCLAYCLFPAVITATQTTVLPLLRHYNFQYHFYISYFLGFDYHTLPITTEYVF